MVLKILSDPTGRNAKEMQRSDVSPVGSSVKD
jgi:hypothetical protein